MRIFLLLLVVIFSFFNANATHLMGGEITWTCIKDPSSPDVGKYVFRMKLYRDCEGISTGLIDPKTLLIWNHPTVTQTTMLFIGNTDISPDCDVSNSGNPALDCATNPVGAVEEYIYESQPIALPGIPTANGWHFTWDACCRNDALSNIVNPDLEGFTLRASMFPFLDPSGVPVPADPCFDDSPLFNESPKTIICTGYPFSYTHNASDLELDSLVYDWDQPLDDIAFGGVFNPAIPTPAPLAFVPPYTFNAPLPGGVVLDPQTGEVSYNSTISGNFASVIRVDAYKCGQIVASIYRDIQAVLIGCPLLPSGAINSPPTISPPFPMPQQYFTSVTAGDLVSFNITATDNDIYANGSSQMLTFEISGGQMADDYVTNTLCANPPCATFADATGQAPPIFGVQFVEGVFEWQTDCIHVASDAGCGITSNIYTFAIKAYDDFCPANAITVATITVEVNEADSVPPPDFDCAWLNDNGEIEFNWNHPLGASPSTSYIIYAAPNIGGPYVPIQNVLYPLDNFSTLASSLPAGSDFFYLTSESLCVDSIVSSDTISPISFGINTWDVTCFEGSDGIISVTVDDYIDVLQYAFSIDGVVNNNGFPLDTLFEGVSAGNHTITVDDATSGCLIDVDVSISAPDLPLQALVSTSTNVCYGSNLGFAVGSGAGGTPFVGGMSEYSYEWFDAGYNSFSVNDTAFGLGAGSYYLQVVDANGCDTFAVVNVIEPSTALDASPQLFNVSCKGDSTGMLVGNASGSWAPYTYYWLDMQGDTIKTSLPNINTRDTLANLPVGNYQLHVWDSQDCFVNYVLNVSEPSSALSIDSMKVIDPIACFGDSVGRARLYFSGGDPNYSYLWDNGETTLIAEELSSGLHSVTLTDAWGCEVTSTVYMPENSLIESDLVLTSPVSCHGESDGSATISTTGGNSNVYTYFWSTGQQTSSVNTDFASGLLHGSYYVTTRDDLGCEVVDSVYISEPDPLIMEASELDWIDCYGDVNGLAFAVAQGGTPSYTFSSSIGVWPTDTVGTLPAGLSVVEVTDSRGCTASDTVFIHEPTELIINIDDSQTILPYCTGVNSASLSGVASGGTPGYTYVWDDNPVQPQTTATATSLLAGIYTITVTDSKGCTASATKDITTITNSMTSDTSSLTLGLYVGDYDVSCYGEDDAQAVVIASGGHAPYTYDWYGPNGYTSNSATISNLIAGTYSVTIRDTNDCMINTSILITEPSQMFFTTLSSVDESCLGACDGEIQVDVTGGVAPYIPIANNQIGSLSTSVMVDSTNILNVCSGTYVISFTDQNSCSAILLNGGVTTQTIAPAITTNAQIDMSSIVNVLCNGSATGYLEVLNPNPDTSYTYYWQDLNGDTISIADTAANLSAGTYILYEDYNNTQGCTTTDTVIVTEGAAIVLSSVITDLSCNSDPTGSISVSQITGGTQPYSYLWNTGATTNSVNNLSAGIYTLNITDSNGCQQLNTFEVTEPDALAITVDNSTSFVLEVGSISGGTPSYNYSWIDENGTVVETNSTFIVVNYGTYYLEVEDANGCVGLSSGFAFTATSQVDLLADMVLNIYPNPFNKETTIDFGREIKEATIRMVDVFGKTVEIHEIKSKDKHVITRGDKASGIYFIEIEIGKEKLFNKIVID
tara:strand:- start:4730 stop:9613 length:4884 start_codon:yes stop_codon:yes gene_type:complete